MRSAGRGGHCRTEAVLEAFRKRGHEVARLADVRKLEVGDIHTVKPRLDLAYITGSALQGAGTGCWPQAAPCSRRVVRSAPAVSRLRLALAPW